MQNAKLPLLIAAILLAMPVAANAVTCYAKVGKACLHKSYGRLDSTCTKDCAVGWRLINGHTRLACLN